jgi:hypothetical protein
MSFGTVNVRWKADGEVVKDQTVPMVVGAVERIGDKVTVHGFLQETTLEVDFIFDPPLTVG